VIVYKDSESEKYLVEPSLQLLVEIAIYCPELMADAEEDLLTLLKDSDDSIKEGVVHIMSKSGASFRKGSGSEGRSNVNLILEQLCVEGNRKQAKYAVSAIAAMTADSGLKALSVLYGRLVEVGRQHASSHGSAVFGVHRTECNADLRNEGGRHHQVRCSERSETAEPTGSFGIHSRQ
jgi:hypothetical protein